MQFSYFINMNPQTNNQDQFDIDQLQIKMNSYNWSQIDSSLSPIPKNQFYQVVIQNPSSNLFIYKAQKYYQRFRYILENQQTHFLLQTLALSTYLLKCTTNNFYALMLRRKFVFNQISLSQHNEHQQNIKTQLLHKRQVLERQLNFMNNLLEDNPKQYHVWTYKKDLITKIVIDGINFDNQIQKQIICELREQINKNENKFIFSLFIQDCRNYHAWDYRFWLVTSFGKIQVQFKWINELISQRNTQNPLTKDIMDKLSESNIKSKQIKPNWVNVNSLWSHKFNLIKYLHNNRSKQNKQTEIQTQNYISTLLQVQINSTISLIEEDRKNECLWNYFRGVINFRRSISNQQNSQQIEDIIKCKIFKIQKWQQINSKVNNFNRFELSFLKYFIKNTQSLQYQQSLQQKINIQLKIIDPVRTKYYNYLLTQNKNS